MNNLLSNKSGTSRNYVDLKRDTILGDVEAGETQMTNLGTGKDMTLFFEEVGEIKGEMERIKQYLTKIQGLNEESKMVHQSQAMSGLRDRMDADISEVTKIARSMKAKLQNLDKANIANRRVPWCEEGSTTDRTRTSITSSLHKKLKDLMGEFQVLRQRMMEEYKQTVERRVYTVTGEHLEEETLESIIATGESETFLLQAIQVQGQGQIMETVREIQDRHDAVKDIQKNLLELHQIFMDMAVLFEAQGEQLNDIEQQVNTTSSFVQRGNVQLEIAKRHQRKTRKCVFICVILLIILVLILVLSILAAIHII